MAYLGPRGRNLKVVTEEGIEKIFEGGLQILEEYGVRVNSPALLDVCDRAGCDVSTKDRMVKMNRNVVMGALEKAPKQVVLHGRDPEKDAILEEDRVNFTFGGTPNAHFIDFETGKFRRPFLKDMAETTKLADACDTLTVMMTTAGGFDAPSGSEHLFELATFFENTTKPIIYPAPGSDMVAKAIKIAEAVAGGPEAMAKRPILSIYVEPTSPLEFSEANDNIINCAEAMVPIVCGPVPLLGATGPMTHAGIAVLGLVENLATLVMLQTVKEGAPFVYGPHHGAMDMKTQRFCYGAPEFQIGWTIQSQMSMRLNLPMFGAGGCNDAKCLDAQAGAETAMSAYNCALSGVNLVHNVGTTAMGDAGSLAMVVVADEICGWVLRMLEETKVDEETLALDLIKKVGPGGNYLKEMHTFHHFRENYMPKFFDRTAHETWVKNGSKAIDEVARARVKKLLSTHTVPVIDATAKKKISQILSSIS